MSIQYVPKSADVVRRVAVGECLRPQGRDSIELATTQAYAALLAANWEISTLSPKVPVHDYNRALPDGDAWKAVYGYSAEMRTERVAAGAVCYSFPLPSDAMRVVTAEYALTEDSALVEGKIYYARTGSGTDESPYVYTAVEEPDIADIASYYERTVAPVDAAAVVSIGARVIGDRYLDQGSKLFVALTASEEPPPVFDFLDAENGEIIRSSTVCATAGQIGGDGAALAPNDRTGLYAEAEIDLSSDPADPAPWCHVCLALADYGYDQTRGAWVEGGAMLDPATLQIEFDRDVAWGFADDDEEDLSILAPLDLGAFSADAAVTDGGVENTTVTITDNERTFLANASRTQGCVWLSNNRDIDKSWSGQDAHALPFVVDPNADSQTGGSIVNFFLAEFAGGAIRGDTINSTKNVTVDVNKHTEMAYGVRIDPQNQSYAISYFSRSGNVAAGSWSGVVFDSGFVALCDCRIVVLGGVIDSWYSGTTDDITKTWRQMHPGLSVARLYQGDPTKATGLTMSVFDGTNEYSATDSSLELLASVDVAKDSTIDKIAFRAPLETSRKYPNLVSLLFAVFPLGVGGGSWPDKNATLLKTVNSYTYGVRSYYSYIDHAASFYKSVNAKNGYVLGWGLSLPDEENYTSAKFTSDYPICFLKLTYYLEPADNNDALEYKYYDSNGTLQTKSNLSLLPWSPGGRDRQKIVVRIPLIYKSSLKIPDDGQRYGYYYPNEFDGDLYNDTISGSSTP